jgi:hypothetical protein
MFNNTALDVNSLGLMTPEANGLVPSPSPLQLNSGLPIKGGSGQSIAFVDAGLADASTLVAGLQADTTVYRLDAAGDALSQITQILAGYQDLASVAIVSHGSDGGLQLGNSWLDSHSLMGQAGLVQSWARALGRGADLLLYGCDVAADAIGQGFVQQLAALTGADVAASSNLTGSAALGGDWVLEYQTGTIEAAALVVANYASVLATFSVTNTNDTGVGSLRAAINQANTAAGADTINFTGSLFRDAAPDLITLTSGQLNIASDITITGTGANKLSISGNNASRVFGIASATKVTISGLFITQGKESAGPGGGIANSGTLTLKNSIVIGNTSNSSGGIYNDGTLTLNNSTVSDNASNFGGGIENFGTLTLNNSTVSGNTAVFGGGIYNNDTLILNNSTVSGNTSNFGGGIANAGTLILNNSTISGNTAIRQGGGISNNGSVSTLTLKNSTVSGNTAKDGGGIFNDGGTLTVNSSTISGNTATSFGGGIFNDRGTLTVNNSTFSSNTATIYGGGIYNNGTSTLKTSTLTGNKATSGGGIFNSRSLALSKSILSGNTATASGGGIYNDDFGGATLDISSTNIKGNTAPLGANIYSI